MRRDRIYNEKIQLEMQKAYEIEGEKQKIEQLIKEQNKIVEQTVKIIPEPPKFKTSTEDAIKKLG